MKKKLISLVIPALNEAQNIRPFYESLIKAISDEFEYEFIFVDDGSTDKTAGEIETLHTQDQRVKLICLARNFGKELATTAGIHAATGDAVITLDADGQHPVELIPELIARWQKGNNVVVGIRQTNKDEGMVKKYGSKLFYGLFNGLTQVELIAGSTDFRLIDKQVQEVFNQLPESNRITRGLIDWLGFERDYIYFHAKPRLHGKATYDTRKLIKLALNSFISLSFTPLYLFGYLGLFIAVISLAAGLFVILEQYILDDPLRLRVTGSASLGILVLFLVGVLLISQWLTSVYISRMYEETKRRPLYIINKRRSTL